MSNQPNFKKYSTRWSEEKATHCKLCQRKRPNFCRRHWPRTTISRVTYFSKSHLDQALSEYQERVLQALEAEKRTDKQLEYSAMDRLVNEVLDRAKQIIRETAREEV